MLIEIQASRIIQFPEMTIWLLVVRRFAHIVFFLHHFDEHFVRDHEVLVSADDLAHSLIVRALFFFRTLTTTNITVIPVQCVKCFYNLAHTRFILFDIVSFVLDQFVRSFSIAVRHQLPAKRLDAPRQLLSQFLPPSLHR